MHDNSRFLMQRFAVNVPIDAKVLDIGALDVNGSLRDMFGTGYVGCDLIAGPNVDIVLTDPYRIPLDDGSVDVVVSANSFEHVAMPWLLALEIDRVLKHGGVVALTAPWTFVYHHPPDYWRMSHEGLRVLFCDWLAEQGRAPYREHATFLCEDSAMPLVDAFFEAVKP